MHTFLDPVKRSLQIAPNKVGFIDQRRSFTFSEFHNRMCRLGGILRELGLKPGDRVAILANNCLQYLETYVGVPAAGFVVVPLNTRHAIPELTYALEDSGARVLLVDRDPGELAGVVEHVINVPDVYEQRLDTAKPITLGEGVTEDSLAGLFYTGGTTGKSKGVMLTHRNLLANTFNWMLAIPHRSDDSFLLMAPLFHAAGSNGVLAAIWNCNLQVTLAAFEPGAALDLIQEHKISVTLGVPTMLSAIAEEQRNNPRDTGTLRCIAHGSSPIATELIRRTMRAFPTTQLMEVYGSTETSPLTTALPNENQWIDHERAKSCGQSLLGNELRILDSNGDEVATGEVGEVVVRGPNVMLGYWKKPEQSATVLKDGHYWTGDLGYMDDEGFVFLVDRSKDMIVSGGENVYCTEVEEVLFKHPAVLEAAAFGIPDEQWGEVVYAVVVPRPEYSDVDPEDIVAFCREHIAGYKVPKGIAISHEPLPKSGPGKVLKRELRAPFWVGKKRDVN